MKSEPPHGDMTVVRTDAGVELRNADPNAEWALELLEQGDEMLTWEDGLITVRAINGTWVWRETGRVDHWGHVNVQSQLISATPPEETPCS